MAVATGPMNSRRWPPLPRSGGWACTWTGRGSPMLRLFLGGAGPRTRLARRAARSDSLAFGFNKEWRHGARKPSC